MGVNSIFIIFWYEIYQNAGLRHTVDILNKIRLKHEQFTST